MPNSPQQDRDAGLQKTQLPGTTARITKYDPEMALQIVERIADGELLKDICARDASPLMCAKSTFLRWVATVPELSKAYAAAQQISALSFEEDAISSARAIAAFPGSPAKVSAANILISQLRWSASRRNPTKYSDKGNLNIVVPVNINANLDLGSQSSSVDVEVPDIYNIRLTSPLPNDSNVEEAEYEEIAPLPEQVPPPEEQAEVQIRSKEQLAALVRTDEPVVGVSHQPLLRQPDRRDGHPGPRKRVLIPGNQRASRQPSRKGKK